MARSGQKSGTLTGGQRRRRHARWQVKLQKNVCDMTLDRVIAETKAPRDRGLAEPMDPRTAAINESAGQSVGVRAPSCPPIERGVPVGRSSSS